MHAIRLHEFGPAENLRYEELPDPEPGAGQVRVAVAASGVHVLDTVIRQGTSGGPFPLPELPTIPGREVAGVVDAVGPEVDGAWRGRRVVAHLGQASGGYAERALAPVGALHALPDALAAEAAVAMIGTGRTAIGIIHAAAMTADDVVLVTAAAGGLGSLLVQAGAGAGALVVGAAGGPAKVERARALGAAIAVDYLEPGWTESVRAELDGRRVTVLLDGRGGAPASEAARLLADGARLVLYSGAPPPLDDAERAARGIRVVAPIGRALLDRPGGLRPLETEALEAATSGRLTPVVEHSFPLADAAAAHRALEQRATVGKVVLAV
ncbi:MAG TPA: zinc-binding dehydrogenase [Solirubrobacteraceae bacterium]|nr:zinc-binding dehydrogenase [Solirubrobacteraceae bacterium]